METTRQEKFWDWSSKHYTWAERKGDPYRYLALKALDLTGEEAVLDVGCGNGAYFKTVQPVLSTGRIVGIDLSPKSVAAAQRRIDENGWPNVEVRQGDATKDPLGDEEFDAAMATCSLSAMPDIDAALDNVYRALRPGGRLHVTDVQPRGLWRAAYRLFAGAPGENVANKVRDRFDTVHMLNQYADKVEWPARSPWFVLLLAYKAG